MWAGTGSQVAQHLPTSSRSSLISFEPGMVIRCCLHRRFPGTTPGLLTRPRQVSLFFEERV